jgi:hypothetical protein
MKGKLNKRDQVCHLLCWQSAHLFVVDPSESWEPYGMSVMFVTRTVPTLRFDCNSIFMKKKNIKNNKDNIFITENLTKFRQSIIKELNTQKKAKN